LKQKAAEVYRKLLTLSPDSAVLKAKLSNVEEELGLTELSEADLAEDENIKPEEVLSSPHSEQNHINEDKTPDVDLIYRETPTYEETPGLDDIFDDKWLLGGEPVKEDDKLKKTLRPA